MKTQLQQFFDSTKRNCVLCHTYRNLKPSEDHKEMALVATKRAYAALKEAFEALRQEDATVEKLEKVKAAKVLCLDALDACNTCDKQIPRIKEILIDIK
ncbi:MAG: hypothetical protein NTY48_02240 [Candidatus Diapherotrites archaeon]|nr:hypothetical protein [Candidatus Diapherotrites archaeon]